MSQGIKETIAIMLTVAFIIALFMGVNKAVRRPAAERMALSYTSCVRNAIEYGKEAQACQLITDRLEFSK